MANLNLKNLSKIYPSGALALYKVNLTLNDGEFIAVIGGEKCGKTTLLRLVAGLDDATEGTINVGDKDVTNALSKDRDIAMIFQGNTLYPSINIFENLAYGLKMRKVSSTVIEQRVKAVAEILGLSEYLSRKPKVLTAEQKQKTAIGRAVVREPKVYLLDDPISGLTPEVRENLRSLLINLQMRLKGTFVYATKNVNEAVTMATRMIVLRDGFLQQVDTPANLYDYPANAYVALIVGSPTVNFVNNATVEREGDAVYALSGKIKWALPENIVARFKDIEEYAGTGKKIILGIRPEDACLSEEGEFKAKVSTVEEIAGVNYAECEHEKLSFAVRVGEAKEESKAPVKGDEVSVKCDLTHALIFDAETRLTLLSRDGGYNKTDFADADFTPLPYPEEETLKKKFSLKDTAKKKK